MITNHADACTNPPRGTSCSIQKIGFVAPIFASAEISQNHKYVI